MKILRGTGLVIGALIVAIALVIVAIALLNMGITSIEQTRQVETGELKPLLPQLVNIPVTLNALDLENDISILVQNRYSKPVEVVRVWLLDENDKPIKIIDASKLFQNQIIQPGNLCFNIIEKPSDNVKYVYVELAKIGIKKALIQPPDIPPTPQPAPPPPPETPVYTSLIGIAKQVTFNNLNKITVQSYEDYETLKESVEEIIDQAIEGSSLESILDELKEIGTYLGIDLDLEDDIVNSTTDILWDNVFDDKEYKFSNLAINLEQDLPSLVNSIIEYISSNPEEIRDINSSLRNIELTEPILLLKTSSPIMIVDNKTLIDITETYTRLFLEYYIKIKAYLKYNITANADMALAVVRTSNDKYCIIRMIERANVENLTLSLVVKIETNDTFFKWLEGEGEYSGNIITNVELKDCDQWTFIPHVSRVQIGGFVGAFKGDESSDYRLVTANYITLNKADIELLKVPLLAYVKISDDDHLIVLKNCKNKLLYQLVHGGSELARMYILDESDIITKVEVKAKRILVSGASRPLTEATITNVKDVFGRKTLLIIITQDSKVYLIENLETLTIYVDGEYKVIEVKGTQGQVKLPGILQAIAKLLGLQGITIDSHTDTAPIQIDANNIEKLKIRVENGEGGTITYTIAQP